MWKGGLVMEEEVQYMIKENGRGEPWELKDGRKGK